MEKMSKKDNKIFKSENTKNLEENSQSSAVYNSEKNVDVYTLSTSCSTVNSNNKAAVISEFSDFPLRKKKKKVSFSNINKLEGLGVKDGIPEISDPVEEDLVDIRKDSIDYRENKTDLAVKISSKNSQVFEKSSQTSLDSTKDYFDLNFELTKKKKSKQLRIIEEDFQKEVLGKAEPFAEKLSSSKDDYTYEYLLSRFYSIAEKEILSESVSPCTKLVLKPPQICRVGSKKTAYVNIRDTCRTLHRTPQHMISFILAELGTSGSIDNNNYLIIKGRFHQNQIENIVRRYVMEYVKCGSCNSLNSFIQKRNRLHFLICGSCQSQRSVANIKSGFQAVTGRRATMRAKTAS